MCVYVFEEPSVDRIRGHVRTCIAASTSLMMTVR